MTIEMENKIEEIIKVGGEFYTKRNVNQSIYAIIKMIDELEEVEGNDEQLADKYAQLDEFVAIRKKLFNE